MKAAATQFPLPEGMNLPLTRAITGCLSRTVLPRRKKAGPHSGNGKPGENHPGVVTGGQYTTQTVDAQAFIDIVGEMINLTRIPCTRKDVSWTRILI